MKVSWNRKEGFTPFELMALIAIITILISLSFSMVLRARERSMVAKGYIVLGRILDTQRMWYSVYRNFNPTEDWGVLGIENPHLEGKGFVYKFDSWSSGDWIQYRAEGTSRWIYGRIDTDGNKDIWRSNEAQTYGTQ